MKKKLQIADCGFRILNNKQNPSSAICNPQSAIFKNERGVLLITSLLLISIIAILSTSFLARSVGERKMITMQANRVISFHLAESGVDDAITHLATNSSYSGTGSTPTSFGQGSYSAEVTTPDPSGNPKVRRIVATGYAPNNQSSSYAYQAKVVTSFVQLQPKSLFNHAVFAEDKVQMLGNAKTDSYNSTLGPYGGTNVGTNGDVGSNTISAGHMSFTGNATVNGDAEVGPGGTPNQVITLGENAVITGSQTTEPSIKDLTPVTVPEGLTNSGSINLSGNTVLPLPAGTYWYDEIKISGNAKLVPVGPVTLYVSGSVDIVGNAVTTTGNIPANFTINVVGEETVKISGNGTFYGVIYAPESGKNSDAVTITTLTGNTEIFGAIIAYEFKANGNVQVHYDDALGNAGGSSQSDVALVSWQES